MNGTYINKIERATMSVCLSFSCGHYNLDLTVASVMVLPFRVHIDSEDSAKPRVGGNMDPWWHFELLNYPTQKPTYPGLPIMSENILSDYLSQLEFLFLLPTAISSHLHSYMSRLLLSSPISNLSLASFCYLSAMLIFSSRKDSLLFVVLITFLQTSLLISFAWLCF